jgi:uncharacterized protein (TIGR03435 family)
MVAPRAPQYSVLVLLCSAATGQSQPPLSHPAFEAVSIKPAVPRARAKMEGGPGTADPGRIDYTINLQSLVMAAYHVGSLQLSAPSWLDTKTFEVVAKLPPATTGIQLREMLQSMLSERFHLTVHTEHRVMPTYTLTVAKNGPTLKEAAEKNHSDTADGFDPLPAGPPNELELDREGYPIVPPSEGAWLVVLHSGRARTHQLSASMRDLAALLSNQLSRPVIDETDLTGRYEFTLSWSDSSPAQIADPGPDLLSAVRQQLGLQLQTSRSSLDVLVVDEIDKDPTEN